MPSLRNYQHPKIDTFMLFQDSGNNVHQDDCTRTDILIGLGNLPIHDANVYIARCGAVSALQNVAEVAVAVSYESNQTVAAQMVSDKGFNLVASAVMTVEVEFPVAGNVTEVAHLIQDKDSLDCYLTFESA